MAEAADGGGGDEEEALAIDSRWHGTRDHRVIDENTNRLLSARVIPRVAFKGGQVAAATTTVYSLVLHACASWHVGSGPLSVL